MVNKLKSFHQLCVFDFAQMEARHNVRCTRSLSQLFFYNIVQCMEWRTYNIIEMYRPNMMVQSTHHVNVNYCLGWCAGMVPALCGPEWGLRLNEKLIWVGRPIWALQTTKIPCFFFALIVYLFIFYDLIFFILILLFRCTHNWTLLPRSVI